MGPLKIIEPYSLLYCKVCMLEINKDIVAIARRLLVSIWHIDSPNGSLIGTLMRKPLPTRC
jgi:hypothetical protein